MGRHGLITLAYEIKTYENLVHGWAFWPDIRKFAPTKISHYTVCVETKSLYLSTMWLIFLDHSGSEPLYVHCMSGY